MSKSKDVVVVAVDQVAVSEAAAERVAKCHAAIDQAIAVEAVSASAYGAHVAVAAAMTAVCANWFEYTAKSKGGDSELVESYRVKFRDGVKPVKAAALIAEKGLSQAEADKKAATYVDSIWNRIKGYAKSNAGIREAAPEGTASESNTRTQRTDYQIAVDQIADSYDRFARMVKDKFNDADPSVNQSAVIASLSTLRTLLDSFKVSK